ncbi:hypothetical protein L0337_45575, partial [candidate division KSB1 bacterium]|nr:hypothetical protein [candidate division KSB1 bacterium]
MKKPFGNRSKWLFRKGDNDCCLFQAIVVKTCDIPRIRDMSRILSQTQLHGAAFCFPTGLFLRRKLDFGKSLDFAIKIGRSNCQFVHLPSRLVQQNSFRSWAQFLYLSQLWFHNCVIAAAKILNFAGRKFPRQIGPGGVRPVGEIRH